MNIFLCYSVLRLAVLIGHRLVTNRQTDRLTDRPCTELLVLRIMAVYTFSDDDMTSASRSVGVLAGGANWGCYGPSLVPVLPQLPGGAQHSPAPSTLRPWFTSSI